MDWECVALRVSRRGFGDDSLSAGNRRRYCRPVLEMKKRAITIGGIALVLILAAVFLWSPSSVPPGQEPLTVLSNADLHEFAAAFDGDTNVPRMVLLLSPT